MEKVIITKDQAAAIEEIKARIADPQYGGIWSSVSEVVAYKINDAGFASSRRAVDELTNDQFIAAMTVGYEIAKDPIQELKEDIASRLSDLRDESHEVYMRTPGGSAIERDVHSIYEQIRTVQTLFTKITEEIEKAGI